MVTMVDLQEHVTLPVCPEEKGVREQWTVSGVEKYGCVTPHLKLHP